MSTLTTNFIHRLQIEQNYHLLADVSEESRILPDEDRWAELFDQEQDPKKQDEILFEYFEALEQLEASWTPLGGPFPSPSLPTVDGQPFQQSLAVAPPLRILEPYVSRVLVKRTPLACRVILLINNSGAHLELSRETLLEAGQALQRSWSEAPELTGSKSKPSRHRKTPILFEIIVLGEGADNGLNRAFISKMRKRFAPPQSILIAGYILDAASRQIRSTTLPWISTRTHYFRHALQHMEQPAQEISTNLAANKGPNLASIGLGVLLALALFIAGRLLGNRFDFEGKVISLLDIVAPLVAVLTILSWSRIRAFASTQARYTVILYLLIYWGMNVAAAWPTLTVILLLNLAIVSVVVWVLTQMLGILVELD